MISKELMIMLLLCFMSIVGIYITDSILITVAIVAGIPFIYKFKNHAFLLFLAFSYFRFQEAFQFLMPFKIPKILAIVTISIILIDIFIKETLKFKITEENKIIFLILAYMPINIIFSTTPSISLAYFNAVYIKVLFMALIISMSIKDSKDLINISRIILLGGVIIGTLAVYNKLNGIGLVEGTRVTISREIRSILGDPNDLALIILFPLSFALSVFSINKNKLIKSLYIVSAIIMVWAILATQSRGGLLGVAIIFVLMANEFIKSKTMLLSLSLMALIVLLLFSGILDRSVLNETDSAVDASAQSRLDSWTTAFYMGIKNPLFGIGMDTFINNYFFYTDAWDGKYHETHSTWLKAFSEGGLIYFILFLSLTYQTTKRILKLKKRIILLNEPALLKTYYSLYYGVSGFIVSSTFLTQTYTWPIYIIWAMSVGLLNVTVKKEKALRKNNKKEKS